MHEALCRTSSTTDIFHAEGGPPITQRTSGLVLLRHKFRVLEAGLIVSARDRHRERRRTMATTSLRHMVAIEFRIWRSVRNGGAARSETKGTRRRLEARGGRWS